MQSKDKVKQNYPSIKAMTVFINTLYELELINPITIKSIAK